jgi:hypothetical protein
LLPWEYFFSLAAIGGHWQNPTNDQNFQLAAIGTIDAW